MRVIAFDTETHLIKPGCPVPKMVCLSFAQYLPSSADEPGAQPDGRGGPSIEPDLIVRHTPQWRHPKAPMVDAPTRMMRVGLCAPKEGLRLLRFWLLDPDVLLVGHNLWFDLGVCAAEDPTLIPLIFDKLEDGLAVDTMVRQQLIDIAKGELKFNIDEESGEVKRSEYHLSDLSYRLLKRYLKKEDTWRLKYALLDGVPLTEWQEAAVEYSLLDSIVTLDIYEAQEFIAGAPIPNSAEQHRAGWALYLMSVWGIRTDPEAVAELRDHLAAEYAEKMTALRPSGLFTITPSRTLKSGPRKGQIEPEKVTKNMKAIYARVTAAYEGRGLDVPMTDPDDLEKEPRVATDRKALTNSGDTDLIALAEVGKVAKLLQAYVPILEGGTLHPINCRYNVLVETGRTSCSAPNLQNPPR